MVRAYWLEGSDGTVLSLDGPEYALLVGASGLGLVGNANAFTEGAGDGARFRSQRKLVRTLVLPVLIQGNSEGHALHLYEVLAGLLDPDLGQATLCAQVDDDVWWTHIVHDSGGDPGDGGVDGANWLQISLAVTSGDPYWTRRELVRKQATPGVTGRGLLRPGGSLTKLRLSSGQITGDVVLDNPGYAPSYPVTTIQGPATSAVLRSALGEVISWSGTLAATGRRVIDHLAKTVVDENGVNRYNELGPAPKFWPVRPGPQSVGVNLLGASLGTPVVDAPTRRNYAAKPEPTGADGALTALWRVYPVASGTGRVVGPARVVVAAPGDQGPEGQATYGQSIVTANDVIGLTPTAIDVERYDGLDLPAGTPFTASAWVRLPTTSSTIYPVLRLYYNASDPALAVTETVDGDSVVARIGQWVKVVVSSVAEGFMTGVQLSMITTASVNVGEAYQFGRALLEATTEERPFFSSETPSTADTQYGSITVPSSWPISTASPRRVVGRSSVEMAWAPRRRVMR